MSGQRSMLRPVSSGHRTGKQALVQKRDWAHTVDVNKPMKNFHTLIQNPARQVSLFIPFHSQVAQ